MGRPHQRDKPLSAYARDAEARSLELLDGALAGTPHQPAARVRERLLESAAADVAELLPQLEQRAEAYAADAEQKLRERGNRERRDLREILETQRDRVRSELKRYSAEFAQLTLGFADDERRQLEENMRSWDRRLAQFERDLASEPDRIADFYEVRARRVEPVGLVYLWPDTN